MNLNFKHWIKSFLGSHAKVWILFFAFALLVRVLSFFFSLIDHDESTYLLVSREMFFNGKTLFVDVYDNKPPGIFLLFGIFQIIPLPGIFVVRLMATLFIATTSWFLYRAKLQLFGSKNLALTVGFFYIFLTSLFNWGLVANTEIFFVFFTSFALFLITVSGNGGKYGYTIIAGLVLGIAYIIKFVALFDFFALAAFWLFLNRNHFKIPKIVLIAFLTSAAFALPFVFAHLWYYSHGYFAEFINATYTVPSRYATRMPFMKAQAFVVSFHLVALPIVLLFYASIYQNFKRQSLGLWKWMPIIWYLLVWVAILLPGKNFYHYFVQLFIPVCFFAPDIFSNPTKFSIYVKRKKTIIITLLLSGFISYQMVDQYITFWTKPDLCKEISLEIKKTKQPGDLVFTNYWNTLYYLSDSEPPSKWVHTSLLFDPKHIKAMKIDVEKEILLILARKPAYIVWIGIPSGEIADYINKNLKRKKEFANGVCLYVLR